MTNDQKAYTELVKKLKDKSSYNYLTTDCNICKAVIYEKKEIVADSWEDLQKLLNTEEQFADEPTTG